MRKSYVCQEQRGQRPNCSEWYPNICRDGGCEWFDWGSEDKIGCDCDGYYDQKLYGCKLTAKGQRIY